MISTFQLWQLAVWVWVWDNPELGEDHDFSLPHWEGQLSQSLSWTRLGRDMFHFLCDSIERTRSLTNATSGDCQKAIFCYWCRLVVLPARTPDGDVKLWLRRREWSIKTWLLPPNNPGLQTGVIFPDWLPSLVVAQLILQTVSCRTMRYSGTPSPTSPTSDPLESYLWVSEVACSYRDLSRRFRLKLQHWAEIWWWWQCSPKVLSFV